ncbi:MAG: ADP-ribosylglycohydrolase family protein [Ruminococcus flavefaciens]|nr:ADP-ribosylglycohydrolase family protein [Ruminococcus flavefaciens]
MLGAVYGDIIGSYYEHHSTKNYDFPLQNQSRFTDDTVMTTAVCKAILENGNDITKTQIESRGYEYAVRYKQYYSYFPYAGYGYMFRNWAKDVNNMKVQDSYGNGGAMRCVPIGYAYNTEEQVLLQAKASCYYTHNHKEAIRGTQAVAMAVFMARNGEKKNSIREYITNNFKYDIDYTIEDIKPDYSFSSETLYSVPPAIVAFLDSHDYESAVRNAVSLGGDADTMACIAGGIAEAFYKDIPEEIKNFCYPKIDMTLKNVLNEFSEKYC